MRTFRYFCTGAALLISLTLSACGAADAISVTVDSQEISLSEAEDAINNAYADLIPERGFCAADMIADAQAEYQQRAEYLNTLIRVVQAVGGDTHGVDTVPTDLLEYCKQIEELAVT